MCKFLVVNQTTQRRDISDPIQVCQGVGERFGVDDAKHMKTPMGSSEKLTKDEAGVEVDPTVYR